MKWILIVVLLSGCSVRVLNFDENSTIKREYDILSLTRSIENENH